MFDSLKSTIRQKLWEALGPPNQKHGSVPIGIDMGTNLPCHYDPPECPVCIFGEFQCHDCGGTIIDPKAPFGVGLESITYNHLHIHVQHGYDSNSGRAIRIPAHRKLCLACFRKDWNNVYPNKKCDL